MKNIAKTLPKDFTIIERRSTTHSVLSNKFGEKLFLKYPRTIEKPMLVELLNELIVDKIHESLGIQSLNAFVEYVDGRLGIIEDFYPLNWTYMTANPGTIISKDLFGRLLVAEVLTR